MGQPHFPLKVQEGKSTMSIQRRLPERKKRRAIWLTKSAGDIDRKGSGKASGGTQILGEEAKKSGRRPVFLEH